MVDHLTKMRARKAAKDYMHGMKQRMESEELGDKSLAGKFECNVYTIERARERLPVEILTESEQELIRQCAEEKARIDERLPFLSKAYLSRHYQVSPEAIDVELDLAGWEDPRLKRKKRRAAA